MSRMSEQILLTAAGALSEALKEVTSGSRDATIGARCTANSDGNSLIMVRASVPADHEPQITRE